MKEKTGKADIIADNKFRYENETCQDCTHYQNKTKILLLNLNTLCVVFEWKNKFSIIFKVMKSYNDRNENAISVSVLLSGVENIVTVLETVETCKINKYTITLFCK